MSGVIEDVAKTWLADQPWQKVFKHTFDVIEDYVSYILVAIGTIALSVRLLTTLGSGDVTCIIIGVTNENSNETLGDVDVWGPLGPYPSGGTVGMLNYAQTHKTCVRAVFSHLGEYLPYWMLLQTLFLIVIEKFTFKIPRIGQKIERFYTNIVQESLFGKDPDAAEDMSDPKTSTGAIARQRQRNEICVSLKRSSFIYRVYLFKNYFEILLVISVYLPTNVWFAISHEFNKLAQCNITIEEFSGVVDVSGTSHFQCHGKKEDFFKYALYIHIILVTLYGICSIGSIVWCSYFRSLTKLLKQIERKIKQDEEGEDIFKYDNANTGKDFLFLFDLLSHSCGVEMTLRVLTHSDEPFYRIFKPNFNEDLQVKLEEDKIKIEWNPAYAEKWLLKSFIDIDSYEATIFPAEKMEYSKRIPVTLRSSNKGRSKKPKVGVESNGNVLNEEVLYSTWFFDLNGGRTEYVITIACIVGRSRMKGAKIVRNLIPYGPEKSRSGMVKKAENNPGTNQIEIFWDPPRGEFTKYFLNIEKASEKIFSIEDIITGNLMKGNRSDSKSVFVQSNILNLTTCLQGSSFDVANEHSVSTPIRVVHYLSPKLTTYTILGLEPGEKYAIELGTMTGEVMTRQTISDIILTKPLPPSNAYASDITTSSCHMNWGIPKLHTCLKGFQIKATINSEIIMDITVPKTCSSFSVTGLNPGKDYDIEMKSLCTAEEDRRTESDPVQVNITTNLEKVVNLELHEATSNSICVKWDPVFVSERLKYKLKIEAEQDENIWFDCLGSKMEQIKRKVRLEREGINFDEEKNKVNNFSRTVKALAGDQKSHTFQDLPDFFGAGFPYRVSIVATCKTSNGKEAVSENVNGIFQTKPYPPSKLEAQNKTIQWSPSRTPHVNEYHISWTQIGINGSIVKSWTTEIITKDIRIPVNDAKQIGRLPSDYDHHFCSGYIFKFVVSAVVNLKSLGIESESEGMGGTFIVAEDGELEFYTERPESPTNMSDDIEI